MGARDDFHAERLTGIGGSDAAAALGQSPYKTAFELWLQKLGRLPDVQQSNPERVKFGVLLEDVVAREYETRTGRKVRRVNQMRRHAKYPFMLAHPDRLVVGERRGLEIKTVDALAFRNNPEWGEPGSDQVPRDYYFQCLHYMSVLDCPVWDLAALIGGNRLEVFHIHRDEDLEQMMIDGECAFWSHVEEEQEPEVDYAHPSMLGLVKRLYPGTNGQKIDLPEDIHAWHRVRVEADALVKQYEAVSDGAKAHILRAMGEAAVGRLPFNSGEYVRKEINRKAYQVDAATYMDFRFRKPKGDSDNE